MSRPDSPLPDAAAAAASTLLAWCRAHDDACAAALAACSMPAPGSPCDLMDVGDVAAAADRIATLDDAAAALTEPHRRNDGERITAALTLVRQQLAAGIDADTAIAAAIREHGVRIAADTGIASGDVLDDVRRVLDGLAAEIDSGRLGRALADRIAAAAASSAA
ncbi:MAG: hypothetical protein OXD37_04500 [Acidimicrobiaceae bacterium]|nr:hypothetical protein [Acidimicrobiaceae bacterium]